MALTREQVESNENVVRAVGRRIVEIKNDRITYYLNHTRSYDWRDPEEWVRCATIAMLVLEKEYPPHRMRVEVQVPRRTPGDLADIAVYRDDACKEPYLVVECKSDAQAAAARRQGIEQLFGNANSLRAPLGLYTEYNHVIFYDIAQYPPTERTENIKGGWDALPGQYGTIPEFAFHAGTDSDIRPASPAQLETKIRRTHSLIWAGGKRDPLNAFDEWSKLLFAKVEDERHTPNGRPRGFQAGTGETTAAVANRIHALFEQAARRDPTIFPDDSRIKLPDRKVFEAARILQAISISTTDVDSIGTAFETFFGSVFRGELGQYFTMRQIARFAVAMLDVSDRDFVIDLTAGSGGFLLEVLLQVWHQIDDAHAGQADVARLKYDFSHINVYGIEIHEILARICKINMVLHHDGHTHIEGDRSCLDSRFGLERLRNYRGKFSVVVGNPPFGDMVEEGDDEKLGQNTLESFQVARGRAQVPSEHVVLERAVDMLEAGGRLALVIPDGLLNNQGEASNCPQVRRYLARNGVFLAIVSLPDYAFRRSGAQNKTSILFYRKYTREEKARFDAAYTAAGDRGVLEDEAIAEGLRNVDYRVFLAEGNYIGYTPTGAHSSQNELYRGGAGGRIDGDQTGTVLGEYRRFRANAAGYAGSTAPDCMMMNVTELWNAHSSRRLDPKYFLFKREERAVTPAGWVRVPLAEVMIQRAEIQRPEANPDEAVTVLTISQTGEIRPRAAGKGRNPPEWFGMYFEDSPSTWYASHAGDVVFSSIDLWKGCIAVVPREFDGALVTKEFPIYRITDHRLDPEFLSCLLRSRYYQRAFRAITTGHSNRRRTQTADFEALEICFPAERAAQRELIRDVLAARENQRNAANRLRMAMLAFSDALDHRGDEEYPLDLEDDGEEE